MALKPTIYKAQISLADSDQNCFEELTLTIAKHPSETIERMTTRLLAFCVNNARGLEFTKGLSTADEPDIWQHADNGEIEHWLELGQPEEPRLRKACGKAKRVSVYCIQTYEPNYEAWAEYCGGNIVSGRWHDLRDIGACATSQHRPIAQKLL